MSTELEKQQGRFSLSGKVAVVTGGHRGIGRDISLGIGRAGGDVIVIDRKGCGDSDVPSELRSLGRRYWSFTADLGDESSLRAAAACAKAAAGQVDILVNNAGIGHVVSLAEESSSKWDEIMRVNLRAPFLLSQIFATGENGMLERGAGAIVNISSVAGSKALEGHAAYAASKAGLDMLTKVMTVEWGGRGVRANAVAPTVVLTEMGRGAWSGAKGEAMKGRIPGGRFAEGWEVADAVVFLASAAAAMVNGETVGVDGGMRAK